MYCDTSFVKQNIILNYLKCLINTLTSKIKCFPTSNVFIIWVTIIKNQKLSWFLIIVIYTPYIFFKNSKGKFRFAKSFNDFS